MTRVFNFSAGPAALPNAVLRQIKEDIPDWSGTGMSVMEVSHRSADFVSVAERAESDVRELMNIPDDYAVLFLQGGATLQFAMAALNLAQPGERADYVVTGSWGKKAAKEASQFVDINVAADGEANRYTDIPAEASWTTSKDAAYLHYTPNETIGGVEFHFVPETNGVPLVADMSSTILSRPIDVSRFGVIYAGAQKNIGPAGVTLVIVHKALLDRARPGTPTLLTYKAFADSGSMTNTPPVFAWYVAGLVFRYLSGEGGLDAVGKVNERKATKLYDVIDTSNFYSNPVRADCRSWMNVPFVLADPELDGKFLTEAADAGLKNLKGHRSVGGMRASIYNAVSEEAVDSLIDFMRHFERSHA